VTTINNKNQILCCSKIAVTEVENLNTMLKSYDYEIPKYQRNYSWQKEHVEDFWNDACDSIEENNKNYYFGPIVLVKTSDELIFKVVDGQQRITTLSILISVIRDISTSTSNGDVHANSISYLISDRSREKIPSLKLNDNNDEYYKDFILKDMDPESKIKLKPNNQYEKNLFNSYVLLLEKIKVKYLGNKKSVFTKEHFEITSEIEDFMRDVLYNFKIFKIVLDNDDDASKLFATLNERGLSLSISDLIKNYIFSKAPENRDDNHKKWQFVIDTLGENIKTDKYLQHHFIAWQKNVKEQNLYSSITKKVRNPKGVTEYLDSLKSHCKNYSEMMSSNEKQNFNDDLKELFLELQNDSAQPFILNAVKVWGKNSDEIKVISKICLDVHFRAKTIGARSAKEIVDAFANCAELVRDHKRKVEISEVTNILEKIDFYDEDFMSLIRSKDFSPKIAKYFLKKIERFKKSPKNPVIRVDSNITAEHIMPKNEDAVGWKHMKEKHDELLNKIGNLTLLHFRPNSEEKDNPFKKKKIKYEESGISITEIVGKKTDWDDVEIISRSKILAGDAPAIWKSIKKSQK
jgi:uncharacterized protein with ParB-like and HNH nuclease domain